jgi:hypothetical protein
MATTLKRTDQPFATAPITGVFENLFRRWITPFTITGITLPAVHGQ